MPADPLPPPPDGRVLVAFDDPALTWTPSWTRLDDHPNLVTSFTIDRGRQYELDRTDSGRAVVSIADVDGILDPTNPSGPYYGKLEPLLGVMLGRRDPIAGEWSTRFRGWIDTYDYAFDPSQRVNRLTLTLVDIFEILGAVEMFPGFFGNPPPSGTNAQETIYFEPKAIVRDRMLQVCDEFNAGIPDDFLVFFSGNVSIFGTAYSAGENVLTVLQETADAEFPGVANLYTDRRGRLCFHGRLARFTPLDIAAEAGPGRWEFGTWGVGDGAAVALDPDNCAHIREFAFERGLSKVINAASATPVYSNAKTGAAPTDPTAAELRGQMVRDIASIGVHGWRSWSAQNLVTARGNHPGDTGGNTSLKETKRFATYYVDNYATPRNRVTACGFRSMNPTSLGAAKTWELLSHIDITDECFVFVASPGGGGFSDDAFYVEGIHEEVKMLTPEFDDVTLRLDLSPVAYFDTNPWG